MAQSRHWVASSAAQSLVPVPGCASTVAVYGGVCYVSSVAGTPDAGVGTSPEAELRVAVRDVRTALRAAGVLLADVLQLTVTLREAAELAALDTVVAEYFESPYPARVVTAALPGGAISVSAIACAPDQHGNRKPAHRDMKETLI